MIWTIAVLVAGVAVGYIVGHVIPIPAVQRKLKITGA